ncbi:hypothetical protein A464_1329 [Salmonella bongori N268-08]|uniref:Uncharacterized protein n=1 Tax=Salmonella bongori N268-08 TaxID=1197719 RepID=S5N7G3_SALBN|nr:hypothetical protein A464_1329 [Salmonella bongori N268-08]
MNFSGSAILSISARLPGQWQTLKGLTRTYFSTPSGENT